jgi:hypothetical protein
MHAAVTELLETTRTEAATAVERLARTVPE